MEYRTASSVALSSKKLSNGHGFAGGSIYDGVFAAPSKFGVSTFSSRVEDYREIFGGSEASRGSSIPFLDVPELNERKILVDVRSSELDYSAIFSGFGESSFAVRYEELSVEPNKTKKSEEARAQAEESSPSEASESSTWTAGDRASSQEASQQALNGVEKFNMSCIKVGNGNANGTTGTNETTYIAQLNAARGYACLIDEVTPLRRAESGTPVFSVVNDECSENSIRERMMQGNQFTRTTTDVRAGKIGKQTSGGDAIFQDNSNWFKSNSMGNSFDKYEVGHGTRPSKLPPSSSLPSNFNLGNNGDKTCTDEDYTNADSPPYFGEEIDTNSVAATSVAALRKAIEEAQARIKMAKELMERKKAGLKNGVKLNLSDGVKPEERKEFKVAYAVNRSKKKTTPEPCKEEDVPLPVYSGTRQQDTAGPCQGTTGFEVREKVPSAKEFDGKTPWKKISSQADQRWEEAEISEVEQFYEVENTSENWSPMTEVDIPLPASAVTRKQNVVDSGNVTEDCKVHEFASSTKEGDRETPWKERRSIQVDHEEEKAELMETTEQFYEVDNTDKNWATVLEFEEVKTMQSVDENEWKGRKRAEEVYEKPQHCGVSPKPAKEVYEKPQHCGISPGPAKEDDNSEKIEKSVKIPNGSKGESDRGKGGVKLVGDEEVPDHEENERKHQVAVEQGESEEIVQASYDNDTYEENPIEFQEPVKDDKRLEIRGLEDIKQMERQSNSWTFFESEKRGEEACKQEKLEKVQSDARDEEDNEETFTVNRASKKEMVKAKLDELHLGKKIANILSLLSQNDESEANGEFEEAGGNEKLVMGDGSQKEEYENIEEETCQWVEAGRTETKIDLSVGDEEDVTAALGEPRNHGNKLGEADKICLQDESDNLGRHQKPILYAENEENVEVSQELPACKEGESISEECEAFLETSENRNERESVKEKYDMVERGLLETDGFPQGLELIKIMKATEGTTEDFSDKHDVNNVGRIEMNFVQHPNDEPARQVEIVHDSREHIEELASETEKVKENVNESEVAVNQEDDKNTTECLDGQGCVDSGNNMKRPQSSDSCEGKGENLELDQEAKMSPGAENDHQHHEETPVSRSAEENEESCRESPPRQNAGTEENDQATVNMEESTSDNSLQKEVELEKEHLRKIDEAKEREREKEKERIAVERAIREARERAFAEARERAAAGRAAAGARQRVPAEARDRIGKTSAEVNDKSVAEKASKEAKLKAERAAVERATAEARERALEKAMSGKAASDARKQNPQYKGPYSSSTSRYPNSSNHTVSSSAERSDRANGESAERCKARSERHQRITERAEKALSEKNRRDLLAQKEQAERNRLAETLDIEVKRWSSGKEGNLRALLSTLQYILGPDSGWQPIPLTDIITATAVKKAYRKATLFVHPDKLQQRGANIQQKYTCEKVFDLLKDGWNKFNVEER